MTKVLVHPGEINSFKAWPMNRRIVASHSDHAEIFVWDMGLSPSASSKLRTEPSSPNIRLQGHETLPTYALGWSDSAPVVASGSRDGSILLWDLGSLLDTKSGFNGTTTELPGDQTQKPGRKAKAASGLSGIKEKADESSDDSADEKQTNKADKELKKSKAYQRIQKQISSFLSEPKPERRQITFKCHQRLHGHTKSIEDLVFKPRSAEVLVSVGVDR